MTDEEEATQYIQFPANQNPTVTDIVEELDNLINIDEEQKELDKYALMDEKLEE